jgi:hypothetical protein
VRIGLASDHIGLEHKEDLKAWTTRRGHATEDPSARRAAQGEYHYRARACETGTGKMFAGDLEGNAGVCQ